jgi:uncharacterized phage-associated protein
MARLSFDFESGKFIAASHYLATRCPDMTKTKLFKLLYFADKDHLCTYGRPIVGGHYVAMKDGPVLSQGYDQVKSDRSPFHKAFSVHGYNITPRYPEVDSDVLSESDIEVLDKTAAEFGRMTAAQLRAKSHEDPAWSECERNAEMNFAGMLRCAEEGLAASVLEDQAIRDLVDDVSLTEEPSRS